MRYRDPAEINNPASSTRFAAFRMIPIAARFLRTPLLQPTTPTIKPLKNIITPIRNSRRSAIEISAPTIDKAIDPVDQSNPRRLVETGGATPELYVPQRAGPPVLTSNEVRCRVLTSRSREKGGAVMATSRITLTACAVSAAVLVACGSPSPGPSVQVSPSPSGPRTLASIAAHPGDVPTLGLNICPDSGPLGDPPRDGTLWKAAQAVGAQESWVNDLRPDCSKKTPGSQRVVNDLLRFKDSAAAEAFFAHERAHAKTDAVLWPYKVGVKPTEGAATGLGASSVTLDFGASVYCVYWIHRSIASSYCGLVIGSPDFKIGAQAVDARIPA